MKEYKFSISHDDGTIVSVMGNKEVITDVLDDFKSLLLAAGFHPDNVNAINYGEDDYDS